MKYSKEKRLDIGRQIYEGELTANQAALTYQLSIDTVREYKHRYVAEQGLTFVRPSGQKPQHQPQYPKADLEHLQEMSHDELIDEVIKREIEISRLKKNYEVKENGTVVRYVKKNTK